MKCQNLCPPGERRDRALRSHLLSSKHVVNTMGVVVVVVCIRWGWWCASDGDGGVHQMGWWCASLGMGDDGGGGVYQMVVVVCITWDG